MTAMLEYVFTLDDGRAFRYELLLEGASYRLTTAAQDPPASWTTLTSNQCSNCPLKEADSPVCPAARNIAVLASDVSQLASYSELQVEVNMPQRQVITRTSAQRAISALLGLLLASSDCPHCRYLRPMARFHLPFADEHETVYRAASMYLLAQYLRSQNGKEAEFALDGLTEIYQNLQQVNKGLAARLREACTRDATVNAVIILDLLAKMVPYALEDSLVELLPVFSSYLEG